jgi:hypothetical protein
MLFMHRRFYKCSLTKMAARFSFDASKSLRRAAASFNHVAAANGLFVVRLMEGRFLGRRERPIGGQEAVADLIR